jgi:hypothetical protein
VEELHTEETAVGATHARRLASDAAQLFGDLADTRSWLAREARTRVDANPFGMLAGAAFVGYVLAGGLAAPLTRRMLRLGLRLAILPLIAPEAADAPAGEMQH